MTDVSRSSQTLFTVFSLIASLVWSFSGPGNIHSDIVITKTATNANGFKTAIQPIDLHPVIPTEASVKLQFFCMPGFVYVYFKKHTMHFVN